MATAAILRLAADGTPNPSGLTYWEVIEDGRPDRTWFTVQRDGWLVAEAYVGPDGWRVASKPREPIPAAVLAELPSGCVAVLSEHAEEG
jgi:hypothetical protein